LDFTLVLLSLAGFAGGFVGSQVGGGALITMPALLFLGVPPVLAIGTGILPGWLTNVVAVAKYWRGHRIHPRVVLPLSGIASLGSFLGARLVLNVEPRTLSRIVAAFFLGLLVLLFKRPSPDRAARDGKPSSKVFFVASVLSFALGIYGGFFSVGVTTFFIFMFVLWLGRDLTQGIADSVLITAVLLIPALFVFIREGNVRYDLAIPLAVTSMAGSYAGAHTALRLGDRWLRWLLAAFVTALVIKLIR
jgi:uncharacterized membrane protein YfcA